MTEYFSLYQCASKASYINHTTFYLQPPSLNLKHSSLNFQLSTLNFQPSTFIFIMKANEQTQQQIERAIRKIAQKFPNDEDTSILTDIHLRASQDSGELLAFDDDDNEITRCVVEEWIDNKDEKFYQDITTILRNILKRMHDTVDNLGILKPYSFTLENDDRENVAELYVADDDTIIIDGDLMEGLDKELDSFFDKLMKE